MSLRKIYKYEIEAGLEKELKNSQANFATAQYKFKDVQKNLANIKTLKDLIGTEQPDLSLIVSVLVSTGWNLNDDIFLPEELWKARFTPMNKPINDNHDATKILGHIVDSKAIDKQGNELTDENNLPDNFDIEVAGVLYKALPELQDRVLEILSKAQSGEMFVSMEVWFPDFAYGLFDESQNITKIIARDEDTAFLTRHLRMYGGVGEYQGYKVGRVLKDIFFGGQGFVENPANPESIIKVAANKNKSDNFAFAKLSDLVKGGENKVMSADVKEMNEKIESFENSLKDIKSQMENVSKALKTANNSDSNNKSNDIQSQLNQLSSVATNLSHVIDKFEQTLSSQFKTGVQEIDEEHQKLLNEFNDNVAKVKELEEEKEKLTKELANTKERAEKSENELNDIKSQAKALERLAKLKEISDVDDEDATLAELKDMSDDTFDVVMKYASKHKDNKKDEENNNGNATKDNSDDSTKKDLNDKSNADKTLDKVENNNDDPSFNVADDKNNSERDQAIATARWLMRRDEKEKETEEVK